MLILFLLLSVISTLFLLNFILHISERFSPISPIQENQISRIRKIDPLTGMTILSPSEKEWLAKEKIRHDQEWNDFLKKKEVKTPLILEKVYINGINGRRVLEVGDLCWYNAMQRTSILFAVRYEDDLTFDVISFDGLKFEPIEKGGFTEIIQDLTKLPQLEFDEGYINIYVKPEYYLIADSKYPDYKWTIGGEGWTGCSAIQKFHEHGYGFDASVH